MELVVVERTFEQPVQFEDIQALDACRLLVPQRSSCPLSEDPLFTGSTAHALSL